MLMRHTLLASLFFISSAFAQSTVSLSGPSPALSASYVAGQSQTVVYTVTNNIPNQSFPFTITGISAPLARTIVSNDCNHTIPAGPSTCNIGIEISPTIEQVGLTINQTLQINYQGRTPLTSQLSFSVRQLIPPIFAYVAPTVSAQVIDQFVVDANTGLLPSNPTTAYSSNTQTYQQLTFASVNGIQYAYIMDPNGAVYWCTINTDGSFSNCLPTASLPAFGSWQARGIAFATFNAQYAYIIDPGNNVVYQCALDIAGDFFNCQQPPSPYNLPTLAPYGIAFATNINGTQQAYIADAGSGGIGSFGDVLLCSMQNDGSFNTCTQTPSSGAPNWIPYAIAFTQVNGTQYAYVADNGTGTPGHVYRCTLNSDGSFSGCIQTPANDSSLTNWYPYYIAFQIVNGTKYAYVVNNVGSSIGNIYRCPLDSNGLLTDCVLTPDTPPLSWQPSGIAFR